MDGQAEANHKAGCYICDVFVVLPMVNSMFHIDRARHCLDTFTDYSTKYSTDREWFVYWINVTAIHYTKMFSLMPL